MALVPFRMGHTALGTGPRLPYFGVFAETNVRLYSIDDAGRHGVLFCSRRPRGWRWSGDPDQPGHPLRLGQMRIRLDKEEISYDSVRRWPRRGLRSRVTVSIGDPVEPPRWRPG